MLATGRSSELFTIKVVVVGGVGKTSLFEVIYIYFKACRNFKWESKLVVLFPLVYTIFVCRVYKLSYYC